MRKILDGLKKYFGDFGRSVAKGDIWTRLSLVIMGAGYIGRKQIVKGILITLLEVAVILAEFLITGPYMAKLNTLGTVQREEVLDLVTLTKTVNDYDNSLLILLYGVIGVLIIVAFVLLWMSNMKAVYRLQEMKENGEHINSFVEDVKSLFDGKFYITLLTLPSVGVLMMNIIPIIFMICIAFTNYDQNHQPPTYHLYRRYSAGTVYQPPEHEVQEAMENTVYCNDCDSAVRNAASDQQDVRKLWYCKHDLFQSRHYGFFAQYRTCERQPRLHPVPFQTGLGACNDYFD